MARVTVEDCLAKIGNRFLLVRAAAKRTRQLLEGQQPSSTLIRRKNSPAVQALREIADGKVHIKVAAVATHPTKK